MVFVVDVWLFSLGRVFALFLSTYDRVRRGYDIGIGNDIDAIEKQPLPNSSMKSDRNIPKYSIIWEFCGIHPNLLSFLAYTLCVNQNQFMHLLFSLICGVKFFAIEILVH